MKTAVNKPQLKRLLTINDNNIFNDELDSFFSIEILRKRLKAPLRNYWDNFVSVYNLFNDQLKSVCNYKTAFIYQHNKSFSCNIYFSTPEHKFMLIMVADLDTSLSHQNDFLQSQLLSYPSIQKSKIAIKEEYLPHPIDSIVNQMLSGRNIHTTDIKLWKYECEHIQKLVFHLLNMKIDFDGKHGISFLAGFQY